MASYGVRIIVGDCMGMALTGAILNGHCYGGLLYEWMGGTTSAVALRVGELRGDRGFEFAWA